MPEAGGANWLDNTFEAWAGRRGYWQGYPIGAKVEPAPLPMPATEHQLLTSLQAPYLCFARRRRALVAFVGQRDSTAGTPQVGGGDCRDLFC